MKNKSKGLSIVVLIFVLAVAGFAIVGFFNKNPLVSDKVRTDLESPNKAKGVIDKLESEQSRNQRIINEN